VLNSWSAAAMHLLEELFVAAFHISGGSSSGVRPTQQTR
jgi:hypothetical protein